MKSKIQMSGDTLIVTVNGKIDYETQEPFKENLAKIAKQKKTDSSGLKIIFDIENLEFVGSSGITQFIQTLKDFGEKTEQKTKILNASSEFKKVMKAFDDNASFEFEDSSIQNNAKTIPQKSRMSH